MVFVILFFILTFAGVYPGACNDTVNGDHIYTMKNKLL